jgi:uncharacterized membrane protein YdjX (TVP38/TMEM64 family)
VPSPEPSNSPTPASSFTTIARRLGPAGPLALIATTLPPLASIALFAYMGTISEWLRSHGLPGLILYTLAFAALAGLALLPTYAQAVLGGFAFGLLLGTPAALIAFTLGAGLGTEIARRATGDRVMQLIAEKPKWLAVRDALVRDRSQGSSIAMNFWRTTGLVALIRVPPNSPFALTNLLLASVKVPRAPLWLGTLIGMTPRTVAAVWIGTHLDTLTSKDDLANATPRWLAITGIAIGVAALVVVTLIANRALKRATQAPAAP